MFPFPLPVVPAPRLLCGPVQKGAVDGSAATNANVSKGTSRGVSSPGQCQSPPEPANSFFHTGQQQFHGSSTPTGNTQLSLFNRVNNKPIDGGGRGGGSVGSGSVVRGYEEPSPSSTPQMDAPFSRTDAPTDSSLLHPSCSRSTPAPATASSSSEPSFVFPSPTPPPPSQLRPSSSLASALSTTSTTSPFSLSSRPSSVDGSVSETQFVPPDAGVDCAGGHEEVGGIDSADSNHNGKRISQSLHLMSWSRTITQHLYESLTRCSSVSAVSVFKPPLQPPTSQTFMAWGIH